MEINPQDVQYYDHIKKELTQPQIEKAIKFVQFNLVEYVENNTFVCKAIPGYNTRNYTIVRHSEWGWECNCQGWQSKKRKFDAGENVFPTCSHVSALYIYFKIKHSKDWCEAQQKIGEYKQQLRERETLKPDF